MISPRGKEITNNRRRWCCLEVGTHLALETGQWQRNVRSLGVTHKGSRGRGKQRPQGTCIRYMKSTYNFTCKHSKGKVLHVCLHTSKRLFGGKKGGVCHLAGSLRYDSHSRLPAVSPAAAPLFPPARALGTQDTGLPTRVGTGAGTYSA